MDVMVKWSKAGPDEEAIKRLGANPIHFPQPTAKTAVLPSSQVRNERMHPVTVNGALSGGTLSLPLLLV